MVINFGDVYTPTADSKSHYVIIGVDDPLQSGISFYASMVLNLGTSQEQLALPGTEDYSKAFKFLPPQERWTMERMVHAYTLFFNQQYGQALPVIYTRLLLGNIGTSRTIPD
jgi:hypothetical protein